MPKLNQYIVNYINKLQFLNYFIHKFIKFYVTCYIPKMNSFFILFRNFETI